MPALDFAPFFVADALGYFKSEKLVVRTFFHPDREPPIQRFLRGELDCLLTGPLRTFDLEYRGVRPPVPSIVTINHKCPFYLIGREPEVSLQLEGLQGKRIILYGGSPPPNLLLKHLIRMTDIPYQSITWLEGITGSDQIRALENGDGDYAVLTQPEVELLLMQGRGHIVLSFVDLFGPLHFSTVVASRSFLDKHSMAAGGIAHGVQRAKRWLSRRSVGEIVDLVAPLAPELHRPVLEKIIRRAIAEEYWVGSASMPRWHYEWLKEAYSMESSSHKRVPFTDGVCNSFADEVVGNVIAEGEE